MHNHYLSPEVFAAIVVGVVLALMVLSGLVSAVSRRGGRR